MNESAEQEAADLPPLPEPQYQMLGKGHSDGAMVCYALEAVKLDRAALAHVTQEPVAWQERQITWSHWYDSDSKKTAGKTEAFTEESCGITWQFRPLYTSPAPVAPQPPVQAAEPVADQFDAKVVRTAFEESFLTYFGREPGGAAFDQTSKNGRLMVATCAEILKRMGSFFAPPEDSEREIGRLIDQRDEREQFIDSILDLVLGEDRTEWSSAYGFEEAIEEVSERMFMLECVPPQDSERLRATEFELEILKGAVGTAYGYLWHVNNEPPSNGARPSMRWAPPCPLDQAKRRAPQLGPSSINAVGAAMSTRPPDEALVAHPSTTKPVVVNESGGGEQQAPELGTAD